MTYEHEITQLDAQLAEAARAEQSAATMRARRAELVRAQELLAEALRREKEARDAAKAAEIAEAEDRRAQAVPLVAELEATDRNFAEIEVEVEGKLWEIVRAARAFHDRYASLVAKHHTTLAQLRALDPTAAHAVMVRHPETLRAFVSRRWARFNGEGLAGDTCHWSRTLAGEEG